MRAHNTGAAWSLLADAGGWQRWGLSALALGVSVVFLIWLRRIDGTRQRLLPLAITLIMGGALGNVIDRLRLGHVIDFVLVHWKTHYFPAFNIADACITLGAIALFYDAFFDGRGQNGRKDAR
jgi:signal peptidase II